MPAKIWKACIQVLMVWIFLGLAADSEQRDEILPSVVVCKLNWNLLSGTGLTSNEPKSMYSCSQIFPLNLRQTLESIGRLGELNKEPDGKGVDVVAGSTSPERVALTAFTESLTTAATLSDDWESPLGVVTSVRVQAGTSSWSWELGGADRPAGIRRRVNCFATSVVTLDIICSKRPGGVVDAAEGGRPVVVDSAVAAGTRWTLSLPVALVTRRVHLGGGSTGGIADGRFWRRGGILRYREKRQTLWSKNKLIGWYWYRKYIDTQSQWNYITIKTSTQESKS